MIHLKKIVISALLLASPLSLVQASPAPIAQDSDTKSAPVWTLDKEKSTITFQGIQVGVTFKGDFNKFSGSIKHDPTDLSKTKITITLALANAITGNLQRDNTLPTEDWFDSITHPGAIFTSTSLSLIEGNNFTLNGTLTLKTITHPLSFPITLDIDEKGEAHAVGEFDLNRLDYNVGVGSWTNPDWVGLNVKVKFDINASKNP